VTRVSVEINGTTHGFDTEPGERVLHAALRNGVALPHECGTGTCGSCRATLVSGSPRWLWEGAPGRKSLRRPNDILLCQVAADTPVAVSMRGALHAAPRHCPAYVDGRIAERSSLTADVALFGLELDRPVAYEPGQFFLVEIDGTPGPRAYSPTRWEAGPTRRLDLLVRRIEGGGASSRLFGAEHAAVRVRVFGPLGRATFDPAERRPFIAIAGGAGIAGILPIVERALASGHCANHPSRLFFGVRDARTGFLLDEVAGLHGRSAGALRATIAISDDVSDLPHACMRAGFVHDVARAAMEDEPPANEPIYYVAGPPPMVDATLRMLVLERRVSPKDIRYDRFG
jgi:toluene monooxygenase electron transfer component